MTTALVTAKPWYREPWPWILMSGPGVVVIAGLTTAWIALTHQDALVADDYYKQGLAINRTLAKQQSAVAMQLEASVVFADSESHLRVYLNQAQAPQLRLRLAHATRAGVDQVVPLQRTADGWYVGQLDAAPIAGKWVLQLEDLAATWRISGVWRQGAVDAVILRAE